MTKRLSLTIRGRRRVWSFTFDGDPKYLEDWRADGLEVNEVVNSIPVWVVAAGLLRPWCWLQSLICGRPEVRK